MVEGTTLAAIFGSTPTPTQASRSHSAGGQSLDHCGPVGRRPKRAVELPHDNVITRLGEGKHLSALLAISKKLTPLGIGIAEEAAPGDAGRLELPLPVVLRLLFLDGRSQIGLRGREPPIAKTLSPRSFIPVLHGVAPLRVDRSPFIYGGHEAVFGIRIP